MVAAVRAFAAISNSLGINGAFDSDPVQLLTDAEAEEGDEVSDPKPSVSSSKKITP